MSDTSRGGSGTGMDELTTAFAVIFGLFLAQRAWEKTVRPWAMTQFEVLRSSGLGTRVAGSITVTDVLAVVLLALPVVILATWVRGRLRSRRAAQ